MMALPKKATSLTLLDLQCESVDRCSRVKPTLIYNLDDLSQYFWAGCGAWHCDYCGPRKATRFASTLAWQTTQVDRSRFVTLTLAPDDWQRRRQAVRDLGRWARKQGYEWNFAWTTEKGSKTGMTHIHGIHHGSFVPQQDLQKRWGHFVDIKSIKATPKSVSTYMTKSSVAVANYMVKGADKQHQDWIALNGGRGIHVSRGYWGELCLREAMKKASIANGSDPNIRWVLADSDQARTVLDTAACVAAARNPIAGIRSHLE